MWDLMMMNLSRRLTKMRRASRRRRSKIARELRDAKFRQRVIEDKRLKNEKRISAQEIKQYVNDHSEQEG